MTPRLFFPQRVLLAAAIAVTACGPSYDRKPGINVLLVTIDTLRADHCSVSGYARETTPGLEALAREGARVDPAYAPTATTGPTHASVFTSVHPITHGVVKNGQMLDEGFATLAETLRDRGYATAGVVSSFVLDERFGYAQGFDDYDDDFDRGSATIERHDLDGHTIEGAFDRRADATTLRARLALERLAQGPRPFFLFVHYFDPHFPYVPPDAWAGKFAGPATDELARTIDAYDAEIAFADDEIGKLLQGLRQLGLERDTLVVITADHGEGLMQRGHMTHGVHVYEEAVRVPLLFRLPGRIPAGRSVDGPVELVDLFPTVLDLAGQALPDGLHGRSLTPALVEGAPLDAERPVHLHRRHYVPGTVGGIAVAGEKFAVRVGQWKYIEGQDEGTRELFDLATDPAELVNLVELQPEIAERARERIQAWRIAYGRESRPAELSPEDRERLRALGYTD